MLGAELGLPVTHLDSHASYIEHWLKLLKDYDRAILTAAAKAEEAASLLLQLGGKIIPEQFDDASDDARSDEHTSELQSLMRTSYADFCLNKNKDTPRHKPNRTTTALTSTMNEVVQ